MVVLLVNWRNWEREFGLLLKHVKFNGIGNVSKNELE